MSNQEANTWRDIVNDEPSESEVYNTTSLTDYIDLVVLHFQELIKELDPTDEKQAESILIEIAAMFEDYTEQVGEFGSVRLQGHGYYLPEESDEIFYLDGTGGIAGEFNGFSIDMLPTYQDTLDNPSNDRPVYATLCLDLQNYFQYTNTDIPLEATGESVSIPLISQDLCATRTEPLYE